MTSLELAMKFHEVYERLAPHFGYETRKETRAFATETPNGRLMIAVCAELLAEVTAPVTAADTEQANELAQEIYNAVPIVEWSMGTFISRAYPAIARALADVRQAGSEAQLEIDCALVCVVCVSGDKPVRREPGMSIAAPVVDHTDFVHKAQDDPWYYPCAAAALRAQAGKETK